MFLGLRGFTDTGSLTHKLSGSALLEALVRVPLATHANVQACCRDLHGLLSSEAFARRRAASGFGPELHVRPLQGAVLAKHILALLKEFLDPTPGFESLRFESTKLESGDKPSHSFEKPYYRFVQLRVGGTQVPQKPMNRELYLDGLDPKGSTPRLRDAWWAVARSIFDGTPVPPSVRILMLGVRRHGGRSAYALNLALVWTGSEGGFVQCSMDPTYLDCGVRVCGGLSKEKLEAALKGLQASSHQTFDDCFDAFSEAADELGKVAGWQEEWQYQFDDSDDDGEEDNQNGDEDRMQSTFAAPCAKDRTWCFGGTSSGVQS